MAGKYLYISGWLLLSFLVLTGASGISKRQATVTPVPEEEIKTPESPESFDQLLEDMFNELGIDTGVTTNDSRSETGTTPAMTDLRNSSATTSSPARTVTISTSSSVEGAISSTSAVYPEEDNLTTSTPYDLSASTTKTTPQDTLSPIVSPPSTPLGETGGLSLNDDECRVDPRLSDFCIIPEELRDFLGPEVTLHDLCNNMLSMAIVNKLVEKCQPGSWCLDSYHAFNHLQDTIEFWTNSSDFTNICWQPIDSCLRTVADYYTGCDVYPMYDFIAEAKKLLCEMKEEPRASRDCIEQTLKALHVSMAEYHRTIATDPTPEACETKNALMTANYLCATGVCGEFADLLSQFKPWAWFTGDVSGLQALCVYDEDKCTTKKEEEAAEIEEEKEEEEQKEEEEETGEEEGTETESTVTEDMDTKTSLPQNTVTLTYDDLEGIANDKNAYAMWVTEEIDVSTVMIIGAITVAALGFFFLVGLVVCLKKRKNRHKTREGVEYMEILPDMDD